MPARHGDPVQGRAFDRPRRHPPVDSADVARRLAHTWVMAQLELLLLRKAPCPRARMCS